MKFNAKPAVVAAILTLFLVGCGLFSPATYNTADYQAIHEAASNGDTNAVNRLLGVHPDLVNVPDYDKNTPLHLAAVRNYPETIDLLLSKGANVNAQNAVKMTPLHLAAKAGYVEAVKSLLKAKPQLDVKDDRDFTPLVWAEKTHNDEVVELLRKSGAK